MPDDDQESTISQRPEDVAASVQGMNPDDQKAAVKGIFDVLTDDNLASSVAQGLNTPERQRNVVSAMPDDQRQQLASTLGIPDKRTRQILWYVVVGTLALAVFLFGILAFVLILNGKSAEAPLALATTALGGVVGLVATSPGSSPSG
jgi:hypothetical protein